MKNNNLVIDFGNTFVKIALFEKSKPIEIFILQNNETKKIKDILKKIKKNSAEPNIIISSVISYPKKIKLFLQKNFQFTEFTTATPIPLVNKYKTPATLGIDRLAAAVGATSIYPKKNILVIDAGTCITYDYINSKNEFVGGSISPGLNIRFKAINDYTANLPLLAPESIDYLTGNNTKQSILSGILNGTVAEMDGFIEMYKKQYKDIIIVLTGGDYKFFEKKLKSSIFAVPNLVLTGLNEILEFNAKKNKS